MPRSKRRKPKHSGPTQRTYGHSESVSPLGARRRFFYDPGKDPLPRNHMKGVARPASSQHPGGNTRGG